MTDTNSTPEGQGQTAGLRRVLGLGLVLDIVLLVTDFALGRV